MVLEVRVDLIIHAGIIFTFRILLQSKDFIRGIIYNNNNTIIISIITFQDYLI